MLAQSEPKGKLCLYDDGSTLDETKRTLSSLAREDERIKLSFGEENRGIAAASNEALAMASGEFVALLDNDDLLSPNALLEVAKALNEDPELDYLYSDEDRMVSNQDGTLRRHSPFFKPDWSPHMLFNCMYTGHLSVYRKSLVEEVGGFRSEYDFSQDYDLALRVTEKTSNVHHIPKVLYHWREIPSSASAGGKPYARKTNIAALEDAVRRRGYDAEVVEYPFANRVHFRIKERPKVSIIIPTDNERNIFNCIDFILNGTEYSPMEIIVVTNTSLAARVENYYTARGVRCVAYDGEFNFSLKCNLGARESSGDYLLFLNDDIEITHSGQWLDELVSVCMREGMGWVSPKLYYEDDTIQYAGMVTGVRDFITTAFHCQPKDSGFYFNMIQSEREVSLLSGACMLIPHKVFEEVGGFDDENTPIMHSDADLCFRMRDAGYSLIYTPFVALRHIGHLSLREVDRGPFQKDKATLYLLKRWGDYLSYDPYFPPNMRYLLLEDGEVEWSLYASRAPERFLKAKDVLFVSHDFSLSGAPILMYHLARFLWEKGVFVTVVSPKDGELRRRYMDAGIPAVVDASVATAPLHGTKRVMAHYGLVVVNTLVMWPMVHAAKEVDLPVALMVHESMAGKELAATTPDVARALRVADRVIFACKSNAELYRDFCSAENRTILHYGTEGLRPPTAPSGHRGFMILHVGSIEPRKGQDLFLDAMERVVDRIDAQVRAVMVGRRLDNPEAVPFGDRLEKRIAQLPFAEWLGQLDHEEVSAVMAEADIFVCSSRDEVFPLTLLEAMSLGKAIVTFDVGGVREMLEDGREALIVPSLDAGALADAVVRLWQDRGLREELGKAAKRRFEAEFSLRAFGQRFLKTIETIWR